MHHSFLSLSHLSKAYGDVQAVRDVSIDIDRGELVSFIGPSGCGKTTLLRMVGGFIEADSGSVVLDGEAIDDLAPEKRATGMVFQNFALFPHMSIAANVAYGLKQLRLSRNERRERVQEALRQVRLEGYGDRRPSELSGGQQQRVAISRCLVRHPKVLLLDEPLASLDANLRMVMRDEIRRIRDEVGVTVLFVTHDQEEALSISDRIMVLRDGQVQQLAAPDVVYDHPRNAFVSDFVGHSNILTGRLGGSPDAAHFDTGDFRFDVDRLFRADTTGERVEFEGSGGAEHTVLVRPERIVIDESSALKAKLVSVVYNGNFTRFFVRIGSRELKLDEANSVNVRRYAVDQPIGIRLPRDLYVISSS